MPNYLLPYWTISVFISICHSRFLSFLSQRSDSCKGSYHSVDLQSVTPPIIPLSLSTSLLVPPSPPTPPHRPLSFSSSQTLLSASDPLLITMSFICGLPAQRDLRIDQMPAGWWALNRVLFQIPPGQREGGRGDRDTACTENTTPAAYWTPEAIRTHHKHKPLLRSLDTPIKGLSCCLLWSFSIIW